MYGIESWAWYGVFAYASTFAVYNGQRLLKAQDSSPTKWLQWVNRNKYAIGGFVLGHGILGIYTLLFHLTIRLEVIAILVPLGIVSALYVIKIGKQNLRLVPYLKIHLIAVSWAGILVIIPLLNEHVKADLLLLGIAHFLYVFAVAIPFDIRDLNYDLPSQKTVPQVLGIARAKQLGILSLVVFIGIMISLNNLLITTPLFYLAMASQMMLIGFTNEKRGEMYFAGLIDGAIALLGIAYLV